MNGREDCDGRWMAEASSVAGRASWSSWNERKVADSPDLQWPISSRRSSALNSDRADWNVRRTADIVVVDDTFVAAVVAGQKVRSPEACSRAAEGIRSDWMKGNRPEEVGRNHLKWRNRPLND